MLKSSQKQSCFTSNRAEICKETNRCVSMALSMVGVEQICSDFVNSSSYYSLANVENVDDRQSRAICVDRLVNAVRHWANYLQATDACNHEPYGKTTKFCPSARHRLTLTLWLRLWPAMRTPAAAWAALQLQWNARRLMNLGLEQSSHLPYLRIDLVYLVLLLDKS